jgi:hypothetical protein
VLQYQVIKQDRYWELEWLERQLELELRVLGWLEVELVLVLEP